LTNLDYAARYLEFLGDARDYESPELWLSDYNRGLSNYETSLSYGDRFDWIVETYDFDDYDNYDWDEYSWYDDYDDYYAYDDYDDYYAYN
jgi:hypothetical protein